MSLDVAVRDAVDTVRATLPSTCSVEVEIAAISTPQMRIGEMIQVLSNLANNSIRAMDGIGLLSIKLVEEAGRPVLVVADNGSGMPETMRKRAMEPFATGAPGGVGLGLSIVRRIVSA